ncbi:MAG: hypothetical protein U9Q98_02925, partial [Bacteroidota bacterium]|nr:hypothetical protein [Bacteroidota bacterium]
MLNAQDECSNAPNIPIEQYSTCGEMALESIDLETATPSSTTPVPSCGGFSSGATNDLWYSFVVPAGINTMAFHAFNSDYLPMFGNGSPACMAVYRGSNCSSLELLDCFDSNAGLMVNGEVRWEQVSGLVPGETIYIRAWAEDNQAQQFFIAASVRLDMEEDECETAVELTTGGCNILSSPGPVQAPEDCGWNTSDNTIFYHFTVTEDDEMPYVIEAENGECVSNEGPTNPEIQFAVWSWDGSSCADVGGSPSSDPPNNTGSYYGCASGTGTVVFSEDLPPGEYILGFDGYSGFSGTSLCTFGFAAPFIDPALQVTLNTNNAVCGIGGSASITVNSSCSGTPLVGWSTGASGSSIDNMDPGNYSVTVTDEDPCGDTVIIFTISDEGSISVNATATGDICNGPFDATAEVNGADPADCTFEWSTDPVQTSQTATGLEPGTYTVTVTYGTCVETDNVYVDYSDLDITVNYDTPTCEGDDATATVEVLNGTAPYSYDWSTGETGSSISLDEDGTYSVTVTDANNCTQEENFNITIYPEIFVENFSDTVCISGDYEVSFDVTDSNGDPADFIVNGTDYSGSYSEMFPSASNYDLEVYDVNGCSEFHFVGSHDCSCVTNAGSMVDLQIVNLCQDECTPTGLHNGDEVLDGDDVFEFILHDGELPQTILATNSTTEFCYLDISGLNTGTTYYISAVAGNDDGSGHPDQADPCYSVAQGKPVVWHQNPIAHTIHNELSVCNLEVEVIANAPAAGMTGTWYASESFSPIPGSTVHDTAMNVLVSGYGDVVFTWTVNNAGCTNSDMVLVHFNQTPVAYAGEDNTVCGLMDTLHAIPSISGSSGYWTGSQVSFENSSNPETAVTANNHGTYTLSWTENNGGCNDNDQVNITFIQQPQPVINTAVDTTCGVNYDLSVSNVIGDGVWTAVTMGGDTIYPTFDPVNEPNTTVTIPNYDGLSQTVIFYWTETTQEQGITCTNQAQTQITFSRKPYAYVGNDDQPEVCGNQYTFDADTIGSGYATLSWVCETHVVNWNGEQNSPDATVTITPGAFGDTARVTIPFIWTLNNIGCSDMDTAFVTFYKEPNANAGNDDSICGLTYDLEAFYNLPQNDGYEPYGFWYEAPDNVGSANFQNEDTAATTVNVNQAGTYNFIWRENNAFRPNCNDRDTVTIVFKEKPVIDAGDDFDVCGQETNLTGVSAGFSGNWLPVSGASFDDINDPG